jgi:hypothetical protein
MIGIIPEVHMLNLIGDPFLYRIRLTGLIALYGRDPVQHALVKEAAQAGENVISVAAAHQWQRPSTTISDRRRVMGTGRTTASCLYRVERATPAVNAISFPRAERVILYHRGG